MPVFFETLQDHAAQIVDEFANPQVVFQILVMLLHHIKTLSSAPSHGDVVFENAVLFNRDAEILCLVHNLTHVWPKPLQRYRYQKLACQSIWQAEFMGTCGPCIDIQI